VRNFVIRVPSILAVSEHRPPWTLEQRRGYAAAIAALAPHVHGLTIA
jgi:hypothetical protein